MKDCVSWNFQIENWEDCWSKIFVAKFHCLHVFAVGNQYIQMRKKMPEFSLLALYPYLSVSNLVWSTIVLIFQPVWL